MNPAMLERLEELPDHISSASRRTKMKRQTPAWKQSKPRNKDHRYDMENDDDKH